MNITCLPQSLRETLIVIIGILDLDFNNWNSTKSMVSLRLVKCSNMEPKLMNSIQI
jgi:hypothetical protein